MKHDIMAFRFFTLSSSVHVKIGLKLRPIVSNRLYRFENTKTWHEVFVEVCDDDFFLREIDEICMTVSDLLIMGCNCSTYFKNRFLVFFFWSTFHQQLYPEFQRWFQVNDVINTCIHVSVTLKCYLKNGFNKNEYFF
jgi:hypothetical protein